MFKPEIAQTPGKSERQELGEKSDAHRRISENEENIKRSISMFSDSSGKEQAVKVEREIAKGDYQEAKRGEKELKERVEAISEEIESKKLNFINRLLEYKKIRELEKNLAIEKDLLLRKEEQTTRFKEMFAAYGLILKNQAKLKKEEEILRNGEKEKTDEEKEEFEGRDLKNLIKKHNCFFVHDIIDEDWKPSDNNRAVNTKELGFQDQIEITAGLSPTISASSLRPDTNDWTFSPGGFGLFLGKGKVLAGAEGDLGTVAYGLRDRHIVGGENVRSVKGIERAINKDNGAAEIKIDHWGNKRKQCDYNELVIENPEVSGIYLKWFFGDLPKEPGARANLKNDYDQRGNIKTSYDSIWSKLKSAHETGLPLFILTPENRVILIYNIDFENRSFDVSPELKPQDMSNIYLKEQNKRELVNKQAERVAPLLSAEEKEKISKSSHS
ncbi:MAG TPA: hypothetical protein PLK35_02770 [Candidatus Moranbacteria bacterium]|nr:hypothetical protein [Candidatus Moranbacteria bacterium]